MRKQDLGLQKLLRKFDSKLRSELLTNLPAKWFVLDAVGVQVILSLTQHKLYQLLPTY